MGLFSDKAASEYRTVPYVSYEDRLKILKTFKGINKIIKQDEWDFSKNLNKIKPHFVIHGDDWKVGVQKKMRLKVIKLLKKWNGKLIEIPYTKTNNK